MTPEHEARRTIESARRQSRAIASRSTPLRAIEWLLEMESNIARLMGTLVAHAISDGCDVRMVAAALRVLENTVRNKWGSQIEQARDGRLASLSQAHYPSLWEQRLVEQAKRINTEDPNQALEWIRSVFAQWLVLLDNWVQTAFEHGYGVKDIAGIMGIEPATVSRKYKTAIARANLARTRAEAFPVPILPHWRAFQHDCYQQGVKATIAAFASKYPQANYSAVWRAIHRELCASVDDPCQAVGDRKDPPRT